MNNWLDTILNIETFAFIGLLIWLLIKPVKEIRREDHIDRQKDVN